MVCVPLLDSTARGMRLVPDTRGLPRAYWLLFAGTFLNKAGGFVLILLRSDGVRAASRLYCPRDAPRAGHARPAARVLVALRRHVPEQGGRLRHHPAQIGWGACRFSTLLPAGCASCRTRAACRARIGCSSPARS